MTIQRFFKKSFYYIAVHFIFLYSFLNHRRAINLFIKLLHFMGVKLNGLPRFIGFDVKLDDFELIEIGHNVVISAKVIFLTHDYSYTNALRTIGETSKTDKCVIRGIKIGDNSFIGMNCILLPGTEIGENVIVGAGSVIRGKIPSDSIVIGNPAQVIGNTMDYAEKLKTKNYTILTDKD